MKHCDVYMEGVMDHRNAQAVFIDGAKPLGQVPLYYPKEAEHVLKSAQIQSAEQIRACQAFLAQRARIEEWMSDASLDMFVNSGGGTGSALQGVAWLSSITNGPKRVWIANDALSAAGSIPLLDVRSANTCMETSRIMWHLPQRRTDADVETFARRDGFQSVEDYEQNLQSHKIVGISVLTAGLRQRISNRLRWREAADELARTFYKAGDRDVVEALAEAAGALFKNGHVDPRHFSATYKDVSYAELLNDDGELVWNGATMARMGVATAVPHVDALKEASKKTLDEEGVTFGDGRRSIFFNNARVLEHVRRQGVRAFIDFDADGDLSIISNDPPGLAEALRTFTR